MKNEKFSLCKSFYAPISVLSDEQLGRLFRAIYLYQLGQSVEPADDIRVAYLFFVNEFERDAARHAKRSAQPADTDKSDRSDKSDKSDLSDVSDLSAKSDRPSDRDDDSRRSDIGGYFDCATGQTYLCDHDDRKRYDPDEYPFIRAPDPLAGWTGIQVVPPEFIPFMRKLGICR